MQSTHPSARALGLAAVTGGAMHGCSLPQAQRSGVRCWMPCEYHVNTQSRARRSPVTWPVPTPAPGVRARHTTINTHSYEHGRYRQGSKPSKPSKQVDSETLTTSFGCEARYRWVALSAVTTANDAAISRCNGTASLARSDTCTAKCCGCTTPRRHTATAADFARIAGHPAWRPPVTPVTSQAMAHSGPLIAAAGKSGPGAAATTHSNRVSSE